MTTGLVFSEDKKLIPDLLTAANKINLDKIIVALIDEKVDEEYAKSLGKFGASDVYIYEGEEVKNLTTRHMADILLELVKETKPSYVILAGTLIGNETAVILGAELNVPVAVEVLDIGFKEGEFYAKRAIYGGKLVQDLKLDGEIKIIVIAPGAFEAEEKEEKEANLIKKTIPVISDKIKMLEKTVLVGKGKPLEEAEIVIGVGRGVKQKDDLKMIYELAEIMGAEVGCTRPLSADYGWFEDWIGVSGKRIRPKLYLAIGVSGSVQHMAGVRASKVIVSINKDGEAPVLEESDYLFVADLYKLVPEIIKLLKQ